MLVLAYSRYYFFRWSLFAPQLVFFSLVSSPGNARVSLFCICVYLGSSIVTLTPIFIQLRGPVIVLTYSMILHKPLPFEFCRLRRVCNSLSGLLLPIDRYEASAFSLNSARSAVASSSGLNALIAVKIARLMLVVLLSAILCDFGFGLVWLLFCAHHLVSQLLVFSIVSEGSC
jgi:hypothetical protein